MAALTTQFVLWTLFPTVPVDLVSQNYETGSCDIQFFCIAEEGVIQIIGTYSAFEFQL